MAIRSPGTGSGARESRSGPRFASPDAAASQLERHRKLPAQLSHLDHGAGYLNLSARTPEGGEIVPRRRLEGFAKPNHHIERYGCFLSRNSDNTALLSSDNTALPSAPGMVTPLGTVVAHRIAPESSWRGRISGKFALCADSTD
jgi:hypothetical protein